MSPAALVEQAAASLAVAGLVLGLAALLATRRFTPALTVALDLLLAAALLRLTTTETWPTIAAAAALVGVRVLVAAGVSVAPSALVGSSAPGR